jgi:hypothetical protein
MIAPDRRELAALPRVSFWASLGLYAAVLVWSAAVLPERVPTHFGANGVADDWSSRTGALVMWAVFGLLTFGGGWAASLISPRTGALVNMPADRKKYWFANEENRLVFAAALRSALLNLVTATGLLLAWAMWLSTRAGVNDDALSPWGIWISLAAYLAYCGYWCWDLLQRTRVPSQL